MTSTQISPQPGIVVATQIVAGEAPGLATNHAEGIVVSTALVAGGAPGLATNHAEGTVGAAPSGVRGR
jgi:hypothetical protein